MEACIEKWLVMIRSNFVNIWLTKTINARIDGRTQNTIWGTNMDDYDAKKGTRILVHGLVSLYRHQKNHVENTIRSTTDINAQIVDRLVVLLDKIKQLKKARGINAQDLEAAQRNYDFGIFHLAVIIAHELCHTFTGYLTGFLWPRTPDCVIAGGHERPGVHGEHGWAWENLLFGGCTVLYQDAIGNEQAGVPYAYIVQTDQNNNT